MKEFLRHLFYPQESNNHRSKLLHPESLLFVIVFLFVAQFFIVFSKQHFPSVLGERINITSYELLAFTNKQRQHENILPLALSSELSSAAALKAKDMFAKGYWAHTSPDGITPWQYFQVVGYDYTYAGENLARGFSTSNGVVDAWMASPTHRENMLSVNYQEVGFAVVAGKLAGEDTTLVVEMFGGKNKRALSVNNPSSTAPLPLTTSQVAAVYANSLIDGSLFTKNIALFVLLVFIVAFLLDMIMVERRKVVRFVGHNLDHMVFLGTLVIFVIFWTGGILL